MLFSCFLELNVDQGYLILSRRPLKAMLNRSGCLVASVAEYESSIHILGALGTRPLGLLSGILGTYIELPSCFLG